MSAAEITSAMPAVRELAVEGVSFSFGEQVVVDNVSLKAVAGEVVAIVGPNGCGKSTLLKLLVGDLRPARGRVVVDGRESAAIGRVGMARRLAMVPQMAGVDGGFSGVGFTVREIVLMARFAAHAEAAGGGGGGGGIGAAIGRMTAMGFETAEDLRLADVAMWGMDVHHLTDRLAETLSGGERQRVAIARALTQETPVLLLDEPTSALDLYHQLELLAQIEAMTKAGRIVVMVTHDLNLAARCAERVIVMDRGKVVANGAPGEVLTPGVLEPVYRVKVRVNSEGELRFERGEIK